MEIYVNSKSRETVKEVTRDIGETEELEAAKSRKKQ